MHCIDNIGLKFVLRGRYFLCIFFIFLYELSGKQATGHLMVRGHRRHGHFQLIDRISSFVIENN